MKIQITNTCPFCKSEHSVIVNHEDFESWTAGRLAQIAFPYLSKTEREQLISGLCPKCQATIFEI